METVPLTIRQMHGSFGRDYFSDYATLDQQFRRSIGADPGDLGVAQSQIEAGARVQVLGFAWSGPVGMIRLDLRSLPAKLGDLYVVPEVHGKVAEIRDTPWLGNGKNYRASQHLQKAATVLALWAGYQDVDSYIHNNMGQKAREWRAQEMLKWKLEAHNRKPTEDVHDIVDSVKRIRKNSVYLTR